MGDRARFAERLSAALNRKGWSIARLQAETSLPYKLLQRWVSDGLDYVQERQQAKLQKVCDKLGVPMESLWDDWEVRIPSERIAEVIRVLDELQRLLMSFVPVPTGQEQVKPDGLTKEQRDYFGAACRAIGKDLTPAIEGRLLDELRSGGKPYEIEKLASIVEDVKPEPERVLVRPPVKRKKQLESLMTDDERSLFEKELRLKHRWRLTRTIEKKIEKQLERGEKPHQVRRHFQEWVRQERLESEPSEKTTRKRAAMGVDPYPSLYESEEVED